MAEAKKTTKKPAAKKAAVNKATAAAPVVDTAKSSNNDIDQNKVFGILAYLGILVLVPLLAAPESKFAQFHAKQGLNLFVMYLIGFFPLFILSFIPILGILAWLGLLAIGGAVFVFAILGIINAANGKMEKLPVIGDFQLIK